MSELNHANPNIFTLKTKDGEILRNRVIKILIKGCSSNFGDYYLITKTNTQGELILYNKIKLDNIELFPGGVEIENTDKSESQILSFKMTDNNKIIVNI